MNAEQHEWYWKGYNNAKKEQREFVGLTEEEKKNFIWMFDAPKGEMFKHFKYMEAIEAKLKEKNCL